MVSEDQTATVNFSLVKVSVGAMGMFDISWNSKEKDLQFTISIRKDSDASGNLTGSDSPVAAARVNATLTYDSSGNNKLDDCVIDTCWSNYGGDTNSNGSVKFSLIGGAPMGLYQAEVTGLTHATQAWSAALDEDNNPDTFIR